jgi:nitrate reductase NapAB chaperone NapD
MVAASGFVEARESHNVGKIANELTKRKINVIEIEEARILFLMERESVDAVRNEIALLKTMTDVKNVHLTYYSVEDR